MSTSTRPVCRGLRRPPLASALSACHLNPRRHRINMGCPTPTVCRRHTTYARRIMYSEPLPDCVASYFSSPARFIDQT
eukprot:3583789-Pleurochrysis_carterae.AAC.1